MHMLLQRFRDFEDGETVPEMGFDIVIERRYLGELHMPTGSLVACDPVDGLETEPFETELQPGDYSVVIYGAQMRDETLCAYAALHVTDAEPERWELATVQDEELDPLADEGEPGYPVGSSLGSFMDARVAKVLMDYTHSVMPDDDEFRRALRGSIHRRIDNVGFGWANIDLMSDAKVPQADSSMNMVAFESGYGPGTYSTYLGYDADDELCRVVTDFEVLDLRFNTLRFGPGAHS